MAQNPERKRWAERGLHITKYIFGGVSVLFLISGSIGSAALAGLAAGGAHMAEKRISKPT